MTEAVEHRSFPARCTEDGPDPQTRAWLEARFRGFLEPLPPAAELSALAAAWQDERRTLHAIHDLDARPDAALGPEVPVATLATFEAGLDAGGPADVPCTLIADVTVRATHQGRGLMRRLMQEVTATTVDAGVPLLALHAAHPALYARFGFAPAIRSASVELDCSRFGLRTPPSGSVHEADPHRADDLARAVAAVPSPFRFGDLTVAHPASRKPGDADRCLVHVASDGTVDGVLTYAFQGWTPQAQVLEVRSEAYATTDAHAALWHTIASTGIASTVRAHDIRLDDPLPWLLTDRAAWRVAGVGAGLSLRVLDPARILELRGWSGPDSELTIEVTDRAGPAAGRWVVRVSGGRAQAEATTLPADITLDASELAALFLAGSRATTLLEAGLIQASPEAARALDGLLQWPIEASSRLHF